MNQKILLRCLSSYVGFFLSRFLGNDLQKRFGAYMDVPLVKMLTLFVLMWQASESVLTAVYATAIILVIHYCLDRHLPAPPSFHPANGP
jgi:hypothetical protein